MLSRLTDAAAAAAIFAASIWLWIVADGFPAMPRYAGVDTDFWPKIVFGTIAVLSGILLVQKTLALRVGAEGGTDRAGGFDKAVLIRLVVTGGLILGYFFALQPVGFVVSTMVFLWAASFVIPYDNLRAKLIFAPVFTGILLLLFTRVLSLPLPRGRGIFNDLSLLLH
jgi:putative tricarboxylic transport membrane protein